MSKANHFIEPEELMAYLDGELSIDRAATAAEHLERCRECQSLAASLRGVSHSMMAWEIEAPEIEIAPAVAAEFRLRETKGELRESDGPAWRSLFTLRRMMLAGGLAVAALLLFAISIPNLLRSRVPAEQAARMATERERALAQSRPAGDSVNGNLQNKDSSVGGPGLFVSDSKFVDSYVKTTDSFGPEYGRNAGHVTNIITKSGTNTVHGQMAATTTVPTGPMIIHTAQITLSTKDFEKTRAGVEDTLKRHNGYVGQMNVTTPTGGARTLNATLRVPASQLESTLAELKTLGRVEAESQGGEEVTQRYVDLEARLANARNSEVRLTQILQRAGKLSDVLAVEEQIETVRGEIEQMQAEKKTLSNQIDFATLTATVTEVYKEQLQVVPNATSTRFRNAAVEGYRTMVDGIVSLLLFLISVAPTLLLWTAILFFPVRWAWRKLWKKIGEVKPELTADSRG